MTTLALAEQQADILASLRRLKGRGTLGDVAADVGLPNEDVRRGLKALLESHRGHLAVSDSGELLYEFDRGMIERGTEPLLARIKRSVTSALTKGFKAWIVIMLVGYFILFVVLVIAALLASERGGDSRRWGRGRRRGGAMPFPNFWFWYWIWGPRWRIGRPYYGHRWERTLDKEDKVPFYKKVFAFVFGPDRPHPTQKQIDRGIIRLIRSRNGVLTTAELVEHTALPLSEAEQEMGRLLGAYDGEPVVSPEGELVYAFPELMTTVQDGRGVRPPNAAWQRLEHPLELTGNTAGANAVVAGMNAFTLVAAATAPWFIFPRLGISGPAAVVGLMIIPIVFSVLFFGSPLLRLFGVKLENRRRHARNVRRVLLGLVYSRALEGGQPVSVGDAYEHVASKLQGQSVTQGAVESALEKLAAELDADVTADDGGVIRYAFPAVRREFQAGELMRKKMELEKRTLGEIVYSTADTPEEADARDQALFDKKLADTDLKLDRYLPPVDQVDFEDDYELVAFDEELERREARTPSR
jgi:hypothetical protein